MKGGLLIGIFTLLLLNSCELNTNNTGNKGSSDDKVRISNICEEYSSPLNIVNEKDTLKIIVQRSDCGEWGGFKEYIFLYRNVGDKIEARFILDTVPCIKIVEENGIGVLDDKLRVVIVDTIKTIDLSEERLISTMLQRLLELHLKNEIHANGGSYFEVINTNGTINFSYWNSGDCRDTYYFKTRRKIFGKIYEVD